MSAEAARPRGRPAAASRDDVLEAARRRYLACERVDVQAIAAELGLGRATIYRWFGSRDALIGHVLTTEMLEVLRIARERSDARGARGLLETLDRANRVLSASPPLRSFLEDGRDAALRTVTSSGGAVQPRTVAAVAALIEEEARAGHYEPPTDPETMAYAMVRIGEAFVYDDAVAGIRGETARLRTVLAALLGLPADER
jgi:AcrR family transcriptional regulator